MPIYEQLHQLCRPLIEAFEDDLLVHDKAMLEQHDAGTPFLHYTRASGTHLYMLIPADQFPRKGERVPYLFGTADREHILEGYEACVRSFAREYDRGCRRQLNVLWFDGRRLKEIDVHKAVEVARDYAGSVRYRWSLAERRCDPVPA